MAIYFFFLVYIDFKLITLSGHPITKKKKKPFAVFYSKTCMCVSVLFVSHYSVSYNTLSSNFFFITFISSTGKFIIHNSFLLLRKEIVDTPRKQESNDGQENTIHARRKNGAKPWKKQENTKNQQKHTTKKKRH